MSVWQEGFDMIWRNSLDLQKTYSQIHPWKYQKYFNKQKHFTLQKFEKKKLQWRKVKQENHFLIQGCHKSCGGGLRAYRAGPKL